VPRSAITRLWSGACVRRFIIVLEPNRIYERVITQNGFRSTKNVGEPKMPSSLAEFVSAVRAAFTLPNSARAGTRAGSWPTSWRLSERLG
jgi:hypothetical protein